MSDKSTIQGKAFEYAVCLELQKRIQAIRPAILNESSSMQIAKKRFEQEIDGELQSQMLVSARAGVSGVAPMEPNLSSKSSSPIFIDLQTDDKGIGGDVRDVLISIPSEKWETGISVKHNHDALKHSRLSPTIDFGKEWYGIPVSEKYWDGVRPIFSELSGLKTKNVKWRELDAKAQAIYVPLLENFMSEISGLPKSSRSTFIKGIFNYLLGSHNHDYYKLVQISKSKVTRITPFNFHGTLYQGTTPSGKKALGAVIPMPTEVVDICLKQGSDNTVLLTFNQGWVFSFRLHNASTVVEPSLKFDVQLSAHPSTLISHTFKWV
jgi:HaeIII restriction endonuclease